MNSGLTPSQSGALHATGLGAGRAGSVNLDSECIDREPLGGESQRSGVGPRSSAPRSRRGRNNTSSGPAPPHPFATELSTAWAERWLWAVSA